MQAHPSAASVPLAPIKQAKKNDRRLLASPSEGYRTLKPDSPSFPCACRGSRNTLSSRVAQIRIPRATRAVRLTACTLSSSDKPVSERSSACFLTSGTAVSDSRRDERSIGTWPPLCYVALCEVGPPRNRIAFAENAIVNLSA